MKTIQLGGHKKGKPIRGYVKVDDSDFGRLNSYNWHMNNYGYAVRNEGGRKQRRTVLMHREILKTITEVDHLNGDKLNNTRSNLRPARHRQNGANLARHKSNTSGYRGVSWSKTASKWQATIHPNGKCIYLGLFIDPKDAAKAYDESAIKHYGKFARLNILTGQPTEKFWHDLLDNQA